MASRTWWRAASVASLVAASAGLAAAPAQAAFTSPYGSRCSGTSIIGTGASFQRVVQQNVWIPDFTQNSTSVTNCPSYSTAGKTVTYNSTGSGAGRNALGASGGVRDANIRFAGVDEPPTPAQEAVMEEGDPANDTDDGVLRTFPAAAGAVTVSVHFPANCSLPSGARWKAPTGTQTFPFDGTVRFKVTNAKIQQVFSGDITTWGQLIPGLTGRNGKTAEQCATQQLFRVVRTDSSGTTNIFKQFLKTVDPAYPWLSTEPGGLANVNWPGEAVPGANTDEDTDGDNLLRGAQNEGVAAKVAATEGSIGFIELAAARTAGFDITPDTSNTSKSYPTDRTFWIPLTNGNGEVVEPNRSTTGYKAGGAKGANCEKVTYSQLDGSDIPANTLQNWSAVTGAGSPAGYPACGLTYLLAWDDAADVYGATQTEQGKARSVKAYVTYATYGAGGQSLLRGADYAPLPTAIREIAEGGAGAIGWNK